MKKIILFLSVIALAMVSCAEKDAFTIKGKLPSGAYDGQQVFLQTLNDDWKGNVNIDTANVVDGQFIFKGLAKEGPTVHFIALSDAPDNMKRPVLLIVEPGEIEVTLDSVSSVKGTTTNNVYQAFQTKAQLIDSEMRSLYEKAKQDTSAVNKQELEKQFEEKDGQLTKETYDFIKGNAGTNLGAYLFSRNYYRFSLDQQKELFAGIDTAYKSNARLAKIGQAIEKRDATSEGKTFTDVKAKTPDGKDAALSDYAGKGKYVLVDFWASWCPPCRAEMPKLVEMYKEFKGKDFEIVGLSLDKDGEAWKKGIKDLNITWPQISDLKYWDSELSSTYGVNSIPHLMLLDKDGKILARGINADQAKEKLAELLK
ncbi:thiol-disulfide isomerase/thioredoxin [Dysgonomonas hofstadii]|uniref:Thiol-disulfide isomerase/thioredoxin n=1 Tax=Dysgonomonas hofstadii TaxID=637886 RepID=A0A840CQJ4_9BACT|nr:TlpA disulfide reductase family protein [Dysgonomonas hofstadii]MBB4038280.1 thiol-disulfide isomerase/thioredoxin [Dysgonomonas hofstadii]